MFNILFLPLRNICLSFTKKGSRDIVVGQLRKQERIAYKAVNAEAGRLDRFLYHIRHICVPTIGTFSSLQVRLVLYLILASSTIVM